MVDENASVACYRYMSFLLPCKFFVLLQKDILLCKEYTKAMMKNVISNKQGQDKSMFLIYEARTLKTISIINLIEDKIIRKEICYNAYVKLMSRLFSGMQQRIKRISLFVLHIYKTERVIL